MKVLNLQCGQGHGFEGWFGSDDDYQQQSQRGLLECPLCADKTVRRLPSAPRLNLGAARPAEPHASDRPRLPAERGAPSGHPAQHGSDAATPEQQSVEALWMQAVRHVMAHTQDVGGRFAEEARRMHYGEAETRGIRGRTTPEEARALDDEGIEVYSLPMPDLFTGPTH
jgi:hypothetical protein